MTGSMKDKVALVTGGASGIGEATSRALSAQGCAVVVADLNGRGAEAVASSLPSASDAEAFEVDVTDSTAMADCVKSSVDRFGRIDILVNVAGTNVFAAPEDIDDQLWHDIVGVNLNGTFFSIRAAIPFMKSQGSGKIVNIASGAGLSGIPKAAHYTASKHGVVGLTKALAADLGPYGINVNAICPGTVITPLIEREVNDQYLQASIPRYPLGRLGKPQDIANAVVFLASSDADWITGVALPVDGGFLSCLRVRHWADDDDDA